MGKKRPTPVPATPPPAVGEKLAKIGKLLAGKEWDENWCDDEWEHWQRELYPDDPTSGPPLSTPELIEILRGKEPSAETIKAIEDWRKARMAPLASGFAKLGMTCCNAGDDLRELLDFEDRAVEVTLPSLLRILRRGGRHRVEALNIIADMLDPNKPGRWKLELRRNVRGAPSERRGSYYHWIALEYFELFEELKERGVRSPAKEAKRKLFQQLKWLSEKEFRTSVQWWRKRRIKLVR